MKKFLIIPLMLLVISVWAQTTPVKIAFDLTSKEESAHQTTMRHVKMMSEAYPKSQFEVVIYGGAISMVLNDKSTVADQIKAFEGNENVKIKVCEGTMKRHNIDKSQLLPGVGTVPDGILELVEKQKEGWGYIKEIPK
ncbi:DsrE family protein [Echinicola salinicaeni]|uniref:DsrE family protein n=1 Tax=Echinicola salinicaeni TaxID=2762757 RepID=UPI00164667DF|nr:DsrE family protein [Echinicola salinicaeni]